MLYLCTKKIKKMDYIHWNPSLEIFSVLGISIRWYGLLWAVGLLGSSIIVDRINKYHKDILLVEHLFFYCFVGILAGARIGHCVFYGSAYFFSSWSHFFEIFIPIRILSTGDWVYTGYAGLASHGGVIGLILALCIYCNKYKVKFLLVLDMIAFAAPFCAMMIRFGNLMNSEIIGCPTDVPWAFIFEKVDYLPRHPAQLYEALFYGCVFVLGCILYRKTILKNMGTGFYFGYCISTIFIFRFFVEFLKEVQEDFEHDMFLDMGQILSIPLIVIGLYFLFVSLFKNYYRHTK